MQGGERAGLRRRTIPAHGRNLGARAGAPIESIATFLNHQSPETTRRFYATHGVPARVPTLPLAPVKVEAEAAQAKVAAGRLTARHRASKRGGPLARVRGLAAGTPRICTIPLRSAKRSGPADGRAKCCGGR